MPQPTTNTQGSSGLWSGPQVRTLPVRPYRRVTVLLVVALAALVMALWLLGTPGGVDGKTHAIGYAICHQIADRSFQVNGHPLPLCARCTGIYLGVMAGLTVLVAGGRGKASHLPPNRVLAVLAVFVVVMGLDGINSYLYLFPGYSGPYQPSNWFRLISGSLTGLAMITIIFPVFNATIWARPGRKRALNGLAELGGVLLVIGLIDALVLLRNPVVLTVFGLISAAGPVVILLFVWTILWLTVVRRENNARSFHDLAVPLIAGLALTFIMLGGIDLLRYRVTHTWEGFDFSTAVSDKNTLDN